MARELGRDTKTLILRIALGISFILTLFTFWQANKLSAYDKQYITYAAELRVLIERFTRHAGEAVIEAKKVAFTYLKFRTNEFSVILEILNLGRQDSAGNIVLPPSPLEIRNKELADLIRIWGPEKANAEIILSNQDLILSTHDKAANLISALQKIEAIYLDIITILGKRNNLSGTDYIDLSQQIVNAQDIEQKIRDVLDVNKENVDVERQFSAKVEAFGKKLQDLKTKYSKDVIFSKLMDIENQFVMVRDQTNDIIQTAQTLDRVNAAWLSIYNMIPTFLEYTTNLEKAYSSYVGHRLMNETTAFILGAITFLLLMALLYNMYRDNQKLEKEIHQLVNELKDLGNGNLAVQATASVGLTASIADAVNYALKALRRLVLSINQTSEKVSVSAEDVKRIASDLNAAINHQSAEIVNVANSTTSMASSIDKVAQNAKKSAQVAENSVDIAHQGALVVNNTIEGMERIRDQIKITEKRIRRLGKSSQEIGEIVSLIDGISEQTNLLSLNASIQAAMAGEVGLGFAVVADEVQQLAVKSSQATKEVETLVKAIQNDTGLAVEAMEEAISEVTAGSKLAQDAGLALDKIEKVSNNLSELIQGISQAADEQADVAGKISKMMEIIESIAAQTSKGTDVTAESISNLAELIQELRNSVAEFKLPNTQYG